MGRCRGRENGTLPYPNCPGRMLEGLQVEEEETKKRKRKRSIKRERFTDGQKEPEAVTEKENRIHFKYRHAQQNYN